jgi:Zn-dependent protease
MPDDISAATRCRACHAEIAPTLLVCPGCGRLVYAERLTELAAAAEQATTAEQWALARDHWRSALELLPAHSPQTESIAARLTALTAHVDTSPAPHHGSAPRWLVSLGLLGLFVWKFKFLFAFALTKGKFLLLGLTKASTFFSMLLAMGVYWSIWGWKFALGFIAMIYVHEMGHVAALRQLGIRADAPMFIPGLGAFVRMKQYPASAREDARVGLAGPLWGLGAAAVCYAIYLLFEQPIFAAFAHAGAVLNLFNLIPVWQLDGSRGMRPLARRGRLVLTAIILLGYVFTAEGMLLLLALVCAWRCFDGTAPARSDKRTFIEFALIVSLLAALSVVPMPVMTPP